MYESIDFDRLFNNGDGGGNYFQGPLVESRIAEAEQAIGYHFPKSYIEFLKIQNGGTLGADYIECPLTDIYGIGPDADAANGIEKRFDLWKNVWKYPDIGIPFGETESGGHDMYYMDFSVVDADGEPRIVRIDNEGNNEMYFVANNFAEFIDKVYRNEDIDGQRIIDERKESLKTIEKELDEINGNLSVCRGLVFLDVLVFLIGGLLFHNVIIIVACVIFALVFVPLAVKLDRKYESVKARKEEIDATDKQEKK